MHGLSPYHPKYNFMWGWTKFHPNRFGGYFRLSLNIHCPHVMSGPLIKIMSSCKKIKGKLYLNTLGKHTNFFKSLSFIDNLFSGSIKITIKFMPSKFFNSH
jgi:hypothetical protein